METRESVVAACRRRWPWRPLGVTSDHVVVLGLLTLSLGLNVYLAARVPLGQVVPSWVQNQSREKGDQALAKGVIVSSIETEATEGTTRSIDVRGSKPTVLYIFRESCGWCARNEPAIAELHKQASGRFRFIGISLGTTSVTGSTLPFETYVVSSQTTPWIRDLSGTPSTVVLSASGTVLDSWAGAYVGPIKGLIEKYFDSQLPSLGV